MYCGVDLSTTEYKRVMKEIFVMWDKIFREEKMDKGVKMSNPEKIIRVKSCSACPFFIWGGKRGTIMLGINICDKTGEILKTEDIMVTHISKSNPKTSISLPIIAKQCTLESAKEIVDDGTVQND